MKQETLSLLSLVDEVVDKVLRRTIPESIKLVVKTVPEEKANLTVRVDPGRIQQVLINLATNARDAMPHGGELRFVMSELRIEPDGEPPVVDMQPGEYVRLSVIDTGLGMTQDVQDHHFEPFFTTKETGQGTGLGLAQVYGIVRQHKGRIDVETQLGVGTAFHIYLPSADGTGSVTDYSPEDTPAPPKGQYETILVVEDARQIRRAIREGLESYGYNVIAVANGREALQTVARSHVDLILTDLVMPEMGGEDLLRALQTQNPALKVIAMTGYVLEADVERLKGEGFADVMTKPVSVEELAAVVHDVLGHGEH